MSVSSSVLVPWSTRTACSGVFADDLVEFDDLEDLVDVGDLLIVVSEAFMKVVLGSVGNRLGSLSAAASIDV